MQRLLIVILLAVSAAVAFQAFGDAVFLDGGSRPVIRHAPPQYAVLLALGFSVAAMLALRYRAPGCRLLGCFALVLLLFAGHQLSEDIVRGVVVDRVAMIPIQRARTGGADAPAPQFVAGAVFLTVNTQFDSFTTLRGVPPFAIRVVEP